MPRNINRFRTRLTAVFSCLALFAFYSYLTELYALDDDVIHSTSKVDRNTGIKQEPADGMQPQGKKRGYIVGVKVDLVMMYTSVFNKEGQFISGLKKENFNLYEDGVPQEIALFSQEDVPVTMGIILDLSASMESRIVQVNKAARAFIEASNPNDQIFLIGFNDEVELLQGFTSDVDEITDALENAPVIGGTALYDAIHLGVEEAHKGDKNKKSIVVISDGEDKDSLYSLNELVSFVQESDVQVFSIFLNDLPDKSLFARWWSKSEEEKAYEALKRISEESGGKTFIPNETNNIHSIVAEIASELRNQYSIGYFSNNENRDGSWRRVVIKLDAKAASDPQLRYRRGYYAPKEQ
jgi:Ca-activated chloride channel family protein